MAPGGAGGKGASASASAEETAYTGKADSYVPTFSGRQSEYREFRKRSEIYFAAKRQSETVFNIVTLLAGRAWDVVEDLTVEELSAPDAFDKVFGRLDATFKFEPITELPADFESFFIGLQRRGGQTVQEYQTEFMRVERRLTNTHKIQLPEKVRAWWFLRRSGLSKEQRQLVLTQLGENNLNLDRTMKAMNFIIGQDTKMDHAQSRWSRASGYKDPSYAVHDEDEEWPEDEEAFYGEEDSEGPADWGEECYDGSGHGDEGESQGPVYNVDEFDSVYATYMEAKSQLNQMRTSRGFYPVVAMIQSPHTERFGGGKKVAQKGKQKGKGKFSGKSRSGSFQKGSAKSRGQAAMSSSSNAGGKKMCLRCGSYGHLAKNCPQPSGTKRKIEQAQEDASINMVQPLSGEMRVDENDGDSEGEDLAVQDGGAASALGSLRQIRKYLRFLVEHGVDINEEVEVFKCKKGFKYGNSHRELTDRCCLVPTFLGGEKQKVLLYVINGGAPILFGRPLLEQFGIVVDYHEQKMKYADGQWHSISKGEKGEYLIHLGESIGIAKDQPVSKVFMPEDFKDHIDVTNNLPLTTLTQDAELQIFSLDDENGDLIQNNSSSADTRSDLHVAQGNAEEATLDYMHFSEVSGTKDKKVNGRHHVTFNEMKEPANEVVTEVEAKEVSQNSKVSQNSEVSQNLKCLVPGTVRKLPPQSLRGMIYEAQLHVKQYSRMRSEAKCPTSRPRVVWEVYAGRGRLSDEVEKLGGISEKFGENEGWDFSKVGDRKKFIKRLMKEQPDELMISPECRLWSPLQELTASRSEGARQVLIDKRKHHHNVHLCFCAVIYEIQRRNGRHATIEHPWNSRAWKTVSFSKLSGMQTYIDQCELGLAMEDDRGEVNPVRKPTCLLTTKKLLFDYMSKFVCSKSHQHTPLEGYIRGKGRRSSLAENYPQEMAAALA